MNQRLVLSRTWSSTHKLPGCLTDPRTLLQYERESYTGHDQALQHRLRIGLDDRVGGDPVLKEQVGDEMVMVLAGGVSTQGIAASSLHAAPTTLPFHAEGDATRYTVSVTRIPATAGRCRSPK